MGTQSPERRLAAPVKAAVTRARSASWLARTRGRPREGGLRILMYHRVADDRDELAVPPRRFREQMDFLAAEGYRAVGVDEALALLDAGAVPPRTVGLTFDDGFADVAAHALPVLAEHGFSATVFVSTGVTAGRARFAWYGAAHPPVLDWDAVVALDSGGTLRFEAHTATHPNLLALDDATAWAEIDGCRRELESRLARRVRAFAYPTGLYGERERRLVAAAGFSAGLTCEPGVNLPGTDRMALRRRQVDARDRLLDFRAKVGGGHDTSPPLRHRYRRLRYGVGVGSPRPASARR